MKKILAVLAFAVVNFPAFANSEVVENNQAAALPEQTIVQDEVKSPEVVVENADDAALKKDETTVAVQ